MSIFNIFKKYDEYGFDSKGVHKNGTKYDANGYDQYGYGKDGTYFNDKICNKDRYKKYIDMIHKNDF